MYGSASSSLANRELNQKYGNPTEKTEKQEEKERLLVQKILDVRKERERVELEVRSLFWV